jgi:hypothetical protein
VVGKDALCYGEGRGGGRHSTVNRVLEQDFLDLGFGQAIA